MGKTIDDLMKQVETMHLGLTSTEDLATLFDSLPEVGSTSSDGEPVVEVQQNNPPTPLAPESDHVEDRTQDLQTPKQSQQSQQYQADLQTPQRQAQGEPSILDQLPEKFKGANVQEALLKAVKSYEELEAARAAEQAELARLKQLVSTLGSTPVIDRPIVPPQPGESVATDQHVFEEIPDSEYFERPNEAVRKRALQEIQKVVPELVTQKLREYHEWNHRNAVLRDFKREHPDFDNYVQDIIAIARTRPDIDQLPPEQSLPIFYNLAKEKARVKLENMKKELGLVDQPKTPPPQPQVDIAELEKRVAAKIFEEIQKRKRAAGIAGSEGAGPVSPTERVMTPPPAPQKTFADEVFERMLATKPKHPDDLLGTGTK